MKVELIWSKRALVWLIPALLTLGGCSRRDYGPSSTYYDRHVAPTLQGACVRSPTGSSCHVTADTHGNALGNLDTSGYNMVAKRRDLLQNYGPYGMPELLVKVVPPFQMQLTAWDGTVTDVTTDIPHAGGSLLDFGSASFVTISRWLARGAQANNVPPRQPKLTLSPCSDRLGHDTLFDPSVAPSTADYSTFVDKVNDILSTKCAAGNCHGSAENSFYLTCGTSNEEKRWNYFAASDYVAADAPTSELLRRALDPAYGGTFHEGGSFFSSPQAPDYQAIFRVGEEEGRPQSHPHRRGLRLLLQAGTAPVRQEGLHAARLPLARGVQQLPPARRQRRTLRPARDPQQLPRGAGAGRAGVTGPQPESHPAEEPAAVPGGRGHPPSRRFTLRGRR